MRLLIVGGVAGGASAAARARRLSESAEIVLFERGPDVSFANCGLPYYVGGEIVDRKKLLVTTPQMLRARFKLDVRTRSSVESIDRDAKQITIRELDTGKTYEETYDKLILAPGAAPLRPPIPGIDLPGIHTLRNLQDVDRIKELVDQGVNHAVVVGAGFIGLELVENFVRRGLATTVVELQDQVLPPFDKEMTTPILELLRSKGVNVILSQSAEAFDGSPEGIKVRLKSGESITAQLVILGVGVRPENKLAVDAGLDVGPRGGIRVNDRMQTSDPDIYAVGDVIEVKDTVWGDPVQVPLAGPANRQGRIAADNVFGKPTKYRGTQGTAIVGVFHLTAAMTGSSEKALIRAKRPYRKVYVHPAHHAGYYPGAEAMTLKVLFDPQTGRIFGGQGIGGAGVDKRIDVLAVAIQAGMTVYDLEEMELAYAPQFGSADPISMVGFVAGGMLRADHPQLDVERVFAMPDEQRPFLLDVRTSTEFEAGHLPGAVNIPIDDLRERMDELPLARTPNRRVLPSGHARLPVQNLNAKRFYRVEHRWRVQDLQALSISYLRRTIAAFFQPPAALLLSHRGRIGRETPRHRGTKGGTRPRETSHPPEECVAVPAIRILPPDV
ncbi:MAG: FAD-dependent oxidoreductase [Planctomycetota bacterium]